MIDILSIFYEISFITWTNVIIKGSGKFILNGPIWQFHNKSFLVQAVAWPGTGDKLLHGPILDQFTDTSAGLTGLSSYSD